MPKKIKKRIPKNITQVGRNNMGRKEVADNIYKIPKEQCITVTYKESAPGSGEIVLSEDSFINGNFTLTTFEGAINMIRDGLENRNAQFNYKRKPESLDEMSIKLCYTLNPESFDSIGIVYSDFPCDAQVIMVLNLAYQVAAQEVAKAQERLVQPAGAGNRPPIGGGRA